MKRFLFLSLISLIASLAFSLELPAPNGALRFQNEAPAVQGALFYTDTLKVVKGGVFYLSHRGIVEGSEKVIANGRFLKRDVDYIIDYANGTILLPGDIKSGTLIVSYHYDPNKQNQSPSGLPLQLAFNGGSSTLSLFTFFRPAVAGQDKMETWIVGSDLTSKLSSNATWRGLLFFSRTSPTNNYLAGMTRDNAAPAPSQKGKAFANWLDYSLGKGKLTLFYQEIDKDFLAQGIPDNLNGKDVAFLKQEAGTKKFGVGYQSSAFSLSFTRQTVDPQTKGNQGVAREKGITKQIISGQIKLSDSLSLSTVYKSATDGKGEGKLRQIELKGNNNEFLRLTQQSITSDFVRGKDLNEPEAKIWAKEIGISRNSLELSKNLLPNITLNLSQTRIKDEKDGIERGKLDLKGKNFSLSISKQEVGRDFARFGNLTEPDAGQLAKEKGLARKTIEGSFNFSPKLQTSFSIASLLDGKEGWKGNSLQLKSDKWQISFYKSEFSEGFRRFGDLTDPEKKRFANEWGIKKSLLSGNFKLDNLLPGLTLSLSSRKIGDSQGSIDGKSIELKVKDQPIFRFATQTIDPSFTRFADLAEADKGRLAQERSAEKKDFFLALPLSKNLAFSTSITKIESLDITRSDGMWGKSTTHSVHNLAFTGKNNLKAYLTLDSTKQVSDVNRSNDIYNLIVEKAFANAHLKLQRMQGYRKEGDKEFQSDLTVINFNQSLKKNFSYALNFSRKNLEDGKRIDEGSIDINSPLLKGKAGTLSFSFKESAEHSFRRIALVQKLDSQSQFKAENIKMTQNGKDGKKQEFSLTRTFIPGLTGNLAYGIQSLGDKSNSYRLLQANYQPQGAPYKLSFTFKDRSGQNDKTTRGLDIVYPFDGKTFTLSLLRNPEDQKGNVLNTKRVVLKYQGSPVLSGEYILDSNYMNGKMNKQYALQYTPSPKFNLKIALLDNVPDPNKKLTRKLNWEIAFPLNDKLSFKGCHEYNFIERENKGVYKSLFAISGKLSAYETLDTSVSLDYSSIAGDKVGGITYRFSYSRNINPENSLSLSGYYTDNFKGKNNVGLRLDLTRSF
ncbi:hypothetical protein H5T88_07245 [bacterium]|nr:hypothetical protein [bacterium]